MADLQLRQLGSTGADVSDWRWARSPSAGRPTRPTARRSWAPTSSAGGNFIDTADAYGRSEEVLAPLIKGIRDDVLIGSKVGLPSLTGPCGARTRRAPPGCGCSARPSARCGGWAPSGSTCTTCTHGTRSRRWMRRCPRSTPWSGPGRSATSASATSSAGRSPRRWAARRSTATRRSRWSPPSTRSPAGRREGDHVALPP